MDEGLYDEDIDWRLVMEQLLKRRNKQAAVRLQFSKPVRQDIWQYLCNKLQPVSYTHLKRFWKLVKNN